MKKRYDTEIERIIRAAVQTDCQPSKETDETLKRKLYFREQVISREGQIKTIHVWYVPMLFNLIVFVLAGAAALLLIGDPWLSILAAGICFYFGAAGILITFIGIRRTGMKEEVAIRIGKGGAAA